MMKYKAWIMIIFISMGVVLAGCGNVSDANNLTKAPQAESIKQEKIKKVLDRILPPGSEYVASKKAEQKKSIFIEDINKDGKQEAVVLYIDMRENRQVHILTLKESNETWNKVSDIATGDNYLDHFSLEDINNDGKKEVIIGTSISDSKSKKHLDIYEWEEKGLVKRVNLSYEDVDIADYNDDGKLDILIIDGEIRKSQYVKMYSYEKGKLQLRSLVKLHSDAYHENIVSGKLADGRKALYIDSGLGAHSMLTEIVAYDKGKLIKVGKENDPILFKAYPLYSKDINNDGIIEVGGMYIPKGFEAAAMAEIPFIHEYVDYRIDGTKQTIQERYVDGGQHFYITIPVKWNHKLTIKRIDKGVRLISNTDKKILFEVKWTKKDSYISSKEKLGETKDTIFYSDVKEDVTFLYNNFHLLKDDF
ncbi:VCBS repeat-containing protein [Clostridium estertheticum]|uniref:FG-GAP repeat domain-containing protein n=1 Tax=Clostridium estertheticum TaxID=238834 RepID=UPI001CF37F5F|nr:VCBS repeat-containing protein [Clostridium estertheticum]MCB2308143.1 VCBS repeat-containing protein [Clostridium estertheticum]MCB2346278.1 VCBS repeat-containing protein [Clostridium estertheticum]MCB2349530.1 VCBS repeat-containing protein [Clostridium estertheticum]WAG46501.1 VCBS repeat-containing protein [Clostridium estertheticum]